MNYYKFLANFSKASMPIMLFLILLTAIFDNIYIGMTALMIYAIDMTLIFNNKSLPIDFCHELGWHLPPTDIKCMGINLNGKCPRCGKDVILDSQGNWF